MVTFNLTALLRVFKLATATASAFTIIEINGFLILISLRAQRVEWEVRT